MAKESFLHRMERNRRARQAQASNHAALAAVEAAMPKMDRSEWIANWRSGSGAAQDGVIISKSAA